MKPRILIVDDDEAITKQLSWTLSHDYDVLTAHDMQTALRRASLFQPVVSVLDLHLPPQSETLEIGLRVLEFIKAYVPSSKVLVMTGVNSIESREACHAVGADGFLHKPFDT